MRILILAAAAVGVAIPAAPAAAQWFPRSEWRDYRQDVREAQRECRRDLRRADSRREYRQELRDCRRDLRQAQREYRRDTRDWRRDHRGPPYGNAWGYYRNRDRWDDRGRHWDGSRSRDRDWDDD